MWIDNPNPVTFEVNRETRTIRGRALPFGDIGNGWTFSAGTLTWDTKVKALDSHQTDRAFGVVELTEAADGIDAVIKVARGSRGDDMLALAEDGVYDGLSIGLGEGVGYEIDDQGIYHAQSGQIRELSLTPFPAFENAKVTSVAASNPPGKEKENTMPDTKEMVTADQVAAMFTQQEEKFDSKIEELKSIKTPVQTAQFQVKEAPLYRFDGIRAQSGRDLSEDLAASLKGDREAEARFLGFMNATLNPRTFDGGGSPEPATPAQPADGDMVDTDATTAVNPARYRPDLFLDELPPMPTPLYDTFYAGTLSSVTPFFYSKFDAASDLWGTHTEGVEPTPGKFEVEAGATITPSADSGRVFFTREALDQGGDPKVSAMVWSKINRHWKERLETLAATTLAAGDSGYTALASPSVGAGGKDIAAALKVGLTNLLFSADGQRFTRFFAAQPLYGQLTAAADTDGRPLFPAVNPRNTDGSVASRLASIDLDGVKLEPTWSTGISGHNSNSYFVDPGAIKIWHSGITKIDKVHESAAGYYLDVFFYKAAHLYDASGIRKVTYTLT